MTRTTPFLALLLSFVTGLAGTAASQEPGECAILQVEGQASVALTGTEDRPASQGLVVLAGATVTTGADGRVVMLCSGDLKAVIGPGTEIEVVGLLKDEDEALGLGLLNGIAGFLFDSDRTEAVQVRTPSAVAAVRSTEWAMQVSDGTTAVFAREGTVAVTGQDAEVTLAPGEGVDVTEAGAVGPVVRWGQARVDRVRALLGPAW